MSVRKRAILFADISPRQEATLPLRGTLLQAFELAESGGLQLTQSCGGVSHNAVRHFEPRMIEFPVSYQFQHALPVLL